MADQRTPYLSVDLDTGGGTERAQGVNLRRSAAGGSVELLGQGTMAQSLPVVIASDQSTLNTQGAKTNNNAAPGATNLGTLPALANAASPTWTEGNQVALSVDLSGALRITGAAAGTEFTTDVASGAGPWAGGLGIMIRDDALTTQETADGDFTAMRANARGAVWVELDSTNGLTPGTAAANLGKAEDDPHTSGDVGVMALAVRQDTATALAGANGDYIPLTVDANGRLHVIDPNAGAGSPTSPVHVAGSATDLAAGSTTTTEIQTTDLGAGTFKVRKFTAWASVAYKAVLQSVDNGTPTVIMTLGGQAFQPCIFEFPHADYGSVTITGGAGFDGFRVAITNLDDSLAADVHGSIDYEL